MHNLLSENMNYLKRYDRILYKRLAAIRPLQLRMSSFPARSGHLTVEVQTKGRKVLLHSKYDPVNEARQFVRSKKLLSDQPVVIYGFGLGYHVSEVLQLAGPDAQVTVVEPNLEIFSLALKYIDLQNLLSDRRLILVVNDDLAETSKLMADMMEEMTDNGGQLIVHRPSLELTPPLLAPLKQAITEWQVRVDSMQRFAGQIQENLTRNLPIVGALPGVSKLFGRYGGVPAVLVASGPTFDTLLEPLAQLKNRCLILSVGRSIKALLKHGIRPDLGIVTDPQPVVNQHVDELNAEVPLIVLPTVYHGVFDTYSGPKLAAFQQGVTEVEELAARLEEPLVQTGGSVATTGLDILIRLGCTPVFFAGLDLCYLYGQTHAVETRHKNITITNEIRLNEIKNNLGQTVKAPSNLNIYRKWIENRIADAASTKFFNFSARGAQIDGALYVSFAGAGDKFFDNDITDIKKELREEVRRLSVLQGSE